MSLLPVLGILIPLACAVVLVFAVRLVPRAFLRIFAAAGALGHAAVIGLLVSNVARHGPALYALGGWAAPLGVVLVVDEASALFLMLIGIGMPASVLFFLFTEKESPAGVLSLLFLLTAAVSGSVATGDLFNLFVFVELTTVCAVGLIARRGGGKAAAHAFVYLLYASLSGILLLLAVSLLYGAGGTLNMAHLSALTPALSPRVTGMAMACVLVSFGIKIAGVPLHFWQAGVYAAAGSRSAGTLSGVVMSCNVYALARVVWTVLGAGGERAPVVSAVFLAGGCINIVVGHALALCQHDLKKLLAFSSVAHTGYILLGLGLNSAAGLAAAMLHTFNHMLMKIAAFWSARGFIEQAESASMRRMRGIAAAAPRSFALFFVAALALVGVPPTHGFASKWLLARAALGQELLFPVLVIAIGTVISLGYYARFFALAVHPHTRSRAPMEKARGALAIIALLALGCIAGGFLLPLAMPFLERAALCLVKPGSYIHIVFPKGGP